MNTSLVTTNSLGYIITQAPTDVKLYSYSTSERLALTNVKRGTLVYDDTEQTIYIHDGLNWDTTGNPITDDVDPSKRLEFDLSGLSHATTRTITMPDADIDLTNMTALQNLTLAEIAQLANIDLNTISNTQWSYLSLLDQSVSTTSSPTFMAPLLKTSLVLEDPGAGANTTTIKAATPLAGSYSITLPPALPASSAVLQSDATGATTWAVSPTLSGATVNGPLNGTRYYTASFVVAGNSVGPVYPILVFEFGSGMFSAELTLTSADWADDSRVASLTMVACGGKPTAGVAAAISAGSVTSCGAPLAQFSTVVTTTATQLSVTKDTDQSVGAGSYQCTAHIKVNGTNLVRIINGNTSVDIVVFTY
jgi:hypothetical protein